MVARDRVGIVRWWCRDRGVVGKWCVVMVVAWWLDGQVRVVLWSDDGRVGLELPINISEKKLTSYWCMIGSAIDVHLRVKYGKESVSQMSISVNVFHALYPVHWTPQYLVKCLRQIHSK